MMDNLHDHYPDFYRLLYILRPDNCCLNTFLEWASPRYSRVRKVGSIWIADALSEFETEWLASHGIALETFIEDILEHED
jgi:hypothetical protein